MVQNGRMRAIRLGLLGCGTVGGGVVRLIAENAAKNAARVGAPVEVGPVLVRDPGKERVAELDRARLTTRPEDVLDAPDVDVVVEVMGGLEPTRGYVARAIERGKQVVTANKMLLAMHGPEIIAAAAARGVDLAFEASVGGGIPIIRVLRDSFASDVIEEVIGIVNGTSNYVLTRMLRDGLSFDAAVKDAQEKGYAEADPSLDVDGFDAAHKLSVLAMLGLGGYVHPDAIPTEGLRAIESADHAFAARFGYVLKSLAIGRAVGERVDLRVHPALVQKDSTLASVVGVSNAVLLRGRAVGPCMLTGRGAGDLPTAVSVVADVLDVARAKVSGRTGLFTTSLRTGQKPTIDRGEITARTYLRFEVYDRPGVLARITGALGDARVSIEQLVQDGGGDASGNPVSVVMLTHAAREADVDRALGAIAAGDYVARPPKRIRVLDVA